MSAKHYRRVVIYIESEGSEKDATAIRDAFGEALDDDLLMPICMEVMQRRKMSGDVKWEVRGERWIPDQVSEQPPPQLNKPPHNFNSAEPN